MTVSVSQSVRTTRQFQEDEKEDEKEKTGRETLVEVSPLAASTACARRSSASFMRASISGVMPDLRMPSTREISPAWGDEKS